MKTFHSWAEGLSRWIDRVAAVIAGVIDGLRVRQEFQLIEQKDGSFLLHGSSQKDGPGWPGGSFRIEGGQADPAAAATLRQLLRGASVAYLLQPSRFVVRTLQLPGRAAEFLDGIVRAQIDRLTPWSPANAAFGWHRPAEAGSERMVVTIAATARSLLDPYIEAAAGLGAGLITISAVLPEPLPDTAAIAIHEQKLAQMAVLRRVRRVLIGMLAGAGALSAVSIAADSVIGGMFEAWHDELTSRIAERRSQLQSGHDRASEAVLELERRKHSTPSSVIIIEALSKLLPDDTYLTELRIQGDKLQIVGITKNAPALIRLIEQSHHFKRAAFFAPTTRSSGENGEHFSIEAHVEPVNTPEL